MHLPGLKVFRRSSPLTVIVRNATLLLLLCCRALAANQPFEVALTAGFNGVLSNVDLLKDNKGAEIGVISTLPLKIWREDANLLTVRGQYTSYTNGIDTPSPLLAAETVKLTNAGHSQIRTDFRQIFVYWDIHWSVGVGLQIPITSNLLAPRGQLTFDEARTIYAAAATAIEKIDRSYAGYLRIGVDQKLLSNMIIIGAAFELNFVETPRTEQRLVFNFYAGAKIF